MDSFNHPEYGLSSQFTVKAMAKKIAKSIVGKSMDGDQRIAPNVPPVRRAERARTRRDGATGARRTGPALPFRWDPSARTPVPAGGTQHPRAWGPGLSPS